MYVVSGFALAANSGRLKEDFDNAAFTYTVHSAVDMDTQHRTWACSMDIDIGMWHRHGHAHVLGHAAWT